MRNKCMKLSQMKAISSYYITDKMEKDKKQWHVPCAHCLGVYQDIA